MGFGLIATVFSKPIRLTLPKGSGKTIMLSDEDKQALFEKKRGIAQECIRVEGAGVFGKLKDARVGTFRDWSEHRDVRTTYLTLKKPDDARNITWELFLRRMVASVNTKHVQASTSKVLAAMKAHAMQLERDEEKAKLSVKRPRTERGPSFSQVLAHRTPRERQVVAAQITAQRKDDAQRSASSLRRATPAGEERGSWQQVLNRTDKRALQKRRR